MNVHLKDFEDWSCFENMKIVFISALIVTLEAAIPVWYKYKGCGVSKYKDSAKQEGSPETFGIAGGKIARPHEFPWTAGILNVSNTPFFYCGAIIISQRWVLTAAHCVDDTPEWIKQVRVVVGEHDRFANSTTNKYRRYHNISSYFIADGYRANESAVVNDVALLKMKKQINISPSVRPICAPDTDKLYEFWQSVTAGWGLMGSTEDAQPSPVLRYVKLDILPNKYCDERINSSESFSENMMCATDGQGDVARAACTGDSGGPLVVKDVNNTFRIVGIVSYAWFGCTNGFPGIYTRVSRFADWITNTIKNK